VGDRATLPLLAPRFAYVAPGWKFAVATQAFTRDAQLVMLITDWFTTLLKVAGHETPSDRVFAPASANKSPRRGAR
jgi:hypothetical protein